jgi:hypothetical protein
MGLHQPSIPWMSIPRFDFILFLIHLFFQQALDINEEPSMDTMDATEAKNSTTLEKIQTEKLRFVKEIRGMLNNEDPDQFDALIQGGVVPMVAECLKSEE